MKELKWKRQSVTDPQ